MYIATHFETEAHFPSMSYNYSCQKNVGSKLLFSFFNLSLLIISSECSIEEDILITPHVFWTLISIYVHVFYKKEWLEFSKIIYFLIN